jgi:hypothetical protein
VDFQVLLAVPRPARGSQRIVADAQCALLVTWRPFLFANAFA